MRALVAASLLILAGCGPGKSYSVDARFRPLLAIHEHRLLGQANSSVTTVGSYAYTPDLDGLLDAYPPGSVELDALCAHEQAHAQHQAADPGLLQRYAADRSFRCDEEFSGYRAEIRWRLTHGAKVNPFTYANFLSGGYGGMIGFDQALAWVANEISEAQH